MNKFNKVAFQGNLALIKINEVPSDAKQVDSKDEYHVLSHSEKGHHHVVPTRQVQLFEDGKDPFVCYLRVTGECVDLVHQRSNNPHGAYRFDKGDVIMVRKQRENSPWEAIREALD